MKFLNFTVKMIAVCSLLCGADEVPKQSWKPVFPEMIIPRDKQENRFTKLLDLFPNCGFKNNPQGSPEQILQNLNKVAESRLIFERPYPEGDSMEFLCYLLPHVSQLRQSTHYAAYAAKVFTSKKQPDNVLRVIEAEMKITSKFRQAPSCIIEMFVCIAMEKSVLELLQQVYKDGMVTNLQVAELLNKYAPDRKQYVSSMKSILNGELFAADGIIRAAYVKKLPENVLKSYDSEEHFWKSIGTAAGVLRKSIEKSGGPAKVDQLLREDAKKLVDCFAKKKMTTKNIDQIMANLPPFLKSYLGVPVKNCKKKLIAMLVEYSKFSRQIYSTVK